jgi:membrane fusion protein (multidrug efflux system)
MRTYVTLSRLLPLLLLPVWGCKKAAPTGTSAAAAAFAVQVVAVPAHQQAVSETVSLVGSVAPNESVEVQAEADGLVKEIAFEEGQHVEKGALLVALEETKLAAQLAEAEANLQLARTSFDRVKQLFNGKLISQQEYDQASGSFAANEAGVNLKRRLLQDARVTAPFSGITGARRISPGQVITKSTPLTVLVDLDTVKVEMNVPERYLSQVATGQTLEFRVAAYPKDSFKGQVYFISPQLDIGTRTALVKARIANADGRLKGGMFASLDLRLQLRESALVIPEPAIINNGDITMVFALSSSNIATMRPVKIGLRLAGKAEVLSGLAAGEMVVVEGVQKLRPGASVKLGSAEAAAPYAN